MFIYNCKHDSYFFETHLGAIALGDRAELTSLFMAKGWVTTHGPKLWFLMGVCSFVFTCLCFHLFFFFFSFSLFNFFKNFVYEQGVTCIRIGEAKDSHHSSLCLRCGVCFQTTEQHLLAKCDDCKKHYHLGCLDPPLTRMPKKTKLFGWYDIGNTCTRINAFHPFLTFRVCGRRLLFSMNR